LEWNTSSPPVPQNFSVLPIVHSRHPLWEQKEMHQGDESTRRLVEALGRWPTSWRAALVTSTVEGRPLEVFRVADPSIWPFISAVGLMIIFGSEIWSLRWLAGIGALIFIASLVGWHWPSGATTTEAEEQAFAREHGILVQSSGSPAVARNGMILTLLVFGVALACFLFSYFYIRLENPVWPPPGFEKPKLLIPGLGLLLWLIGLIPMAWAARAVHKDDQRALRNGLLLSFLLSTIATGLTMYSLLTKSYSVSDHAYASLFILIEGFLALLMIGGIGMNLFVQVFARRGEYSASRYIAIENTALYFYVSTVFGLIIFAVLYGAPYLT
jgi:cytochrome c oxidase subunit I+III